MLLFLLILFVVCCFTFFFLTCPLPYNAPILVDNFFLLLENKSGSVFVGTASCFLGVEIFSFCTFVAGLPCNAAALSFNGLTFFCGKF